MIPTLPSTRDSSSIASTYSTYPIPAPPRVSGKITPSSPISPSFFTTSWGNSLFSSHSLTCGAISPSANARTALCNCFCSSVNPNIFLPSVHIIDSYRCITSAHTLACPAGRASCAEGGRSHTSLTCPAKQGLAGPPVGREHHQPSNARPHAFHPAKTGTPATKWPPHAQWARPAGHPLLYPIQSLPQIRHNILHILNPYGHPHQPIRNPKPRPSFSAN